MDSIQSFLAKSQQERNNLLNHTRAKLEYGFDYIYKLSLIEWGIKDQQDHIITDHAQIKIPKIHREWIHQFNLPGRNKAIIAPRSFSKSSTVKIYAIEQILEQKERFVLIISSKGTQAQAQLEGLKKVLQNQTLQEIKGFTIIKDNTSEIVIEFTKNGIKTRSKILAGSANTSLLGMNFEGIRPGLVILDDIETIEQARSETLTNSLQEWMFKTFDNIFANISTGKLILIGTVLTSDCIANRIALNKEDEFGNKVFSDWECIKYQALDENDESTWPTRFPTKNLHQRRDVNPRVFASDYMNAPLEDTDIILTPAMLQEYKLSEFGTKNDEGAIIDKPTQRNQIITEAYAHFDLNVTSKESSDFFAGILLGKSLDGNIYVLDIVHDKPRVEEQAKIIVDYWVKWKKQYKLQVVSIDGIGYQEALKHWIDKYARERGVYPTIKAAKYYKDKKTHFASHEPLFTTNSVYLPVDHPKYKDFRREILNFPNAKHDDMVDAFSFAADFIHKKKKAKGSNRSFMTNVTRL